MRSKDSLLVKMSLQEVQQEELRLLKAFCNHCNNLGIRWSLAYGTLLGAVRHKGFIPWDDDVDTLVLRESYEKFLSNPLENSHFGTIRPGDLGCPWLFAKVYSKRTLWNETYTRHSDRLGVFIDVFPWDSVNPARARSFYQDVQRSSKPYYYAYSFDYTDRRYRSLGGIIRRAVGAFARLKPIDFYQKRMSNLIAQSSGHGSLVNYYSPYSFEQEYVEESLCQVTVPVEFEGNVFPCLGDPEMHLQRVYGKSWMTPVKHDEHLHGEAFWRYKQ